MERDAVNKRGERIMKTVDIDKQRGNYEQFLTSRKQMIISLIDEEGKPFTSNAPFVMKDGKFYIYVSQIAEHYQLLEKNEVADAFFIADEADTPNKFATERARWQCKATNIGNEGHEEIFSLFNEAFGEKMLDVLRGLDFSLFELAPKTGRYVVGFGLAFDLDVESDGFHHVVVDNKKDR